MSEYHRFLANQIEKTVRDLPVQSVCDYGCYTGSLLLELQQRLPDTERFTGIDFFDAFKIQKNQPENGPPIRYIDRDSDNYKALLDTPQFDVIISTAALHHYRCPINELQTIAQMIRPGGHLVVIDFNCKYSNNAEVTKNVLSYFEEILASTRNKFHHHHYSLEQAEDLFRGVDLEIVHSGEMIYPENPEEMATDKEDTLQRVNRKLEHLDGAPEIHREIFSVIFNLEKQLLEKYGVDYRSMFQILAQKPTQ